MLSLAVYLQRYLWEAILSQSIYTAVEQIFKPMLIVLPFYCKITCYNCHVSYWLADMKYVTDTSIPLIATDTGYVTDIFIPRSKMLLTFLYHETICYWHVHTTDSMLLTHPYHWQYVHTTKRWITEISIPQGNMLVPLYMYHGAMCWRYFYIPQDNMWH